MSELTLGEVVKRTGADKRKLRQALERGEIQGTKGAGKTGAWRVPESEIEKAAALRVRPFSATSTKPQKRGMTRAATASLVGLGDEWLSYGEVAKLLGVHKDTIRQRVVRGALTSREVPHGERTLHFVNRNDLALPAKRPYTRKATTALVKPSGGEQLTLLQAARRKGCSINSIYTRVKRGILPSTHVQIGPKQFAYYVSATDVDAISLSKRGGDTRSSKAVLAGTRVHAELTNGPSLTDRFIELAALVRAGGYSVESLDVVVRVKGE